MNEVYHTDMNTFVQTNNDRGGTCFLPPQTSIRQWILQSEELQVVGAASADTQQHFQLQQKRVRFDPGPDHVHETYEKYTHYFSEYDRRPFAKRSQKTPKQIRDIFEEIEELRRELFMGQTSFPVLTEAEIETEIDTEDSSSSMDGLTMHVNANAQREVHAIAQAVTHAHVHVDMDVQSSVNQDQMGEDNLSGSESDGLSGCVSEQEDELLDSKFGGNQLRRFTYASNASVASTPKELSSTYTSEQSAPQRQQSRKYVDHARAISTHVPHTRARTQDTLQMQMRKRSISNRALLVCDSVTNLRRFNSVGHTTRYDNVFGVTPNVNTHCMDQETSTQHENQSVQNQSPSLGSVHMAQCMRQSSETNCTLSGKKVYSSNHAYDINRRVDHAEAPSFRWRKQSGFSGDIAYMDLREHVRLPQQTLISETLESETNSQASLAEMLAQNVDTDMDTSRGYGKDLRIQRDMWGRTIVHPVFLDKEVESGIDTDNSMGRSDSRNVSCSPSESMRSGSDTDM
ncbi:hypothetical protein SARC_10706 [Sphaeroforma arctica JP610]|uniref:Uncharacterized protein n=1 Tax=Sphaeroforma arctica JP610 TaxID=667725 RepID=A0A0L0FLB0_9EUKA|nr:hypothetical protein SARC_10706 [Sphaeroforma arctica JP610]KNC76808.1 hypothetical protein SARC_10706 [Sphaeroforma arctica JP610]|eukprot:XP_014150710.1 hypothetical protein SARC_10706 [Sphaeroforma arctica JP610]